jgi:hypothetical protein
MGRAVFYYGIEIYSVLTELLVHLAVLPHGGVK